MLDDEILERLSFRLGDNAIGFAKELKNRVDAIREYFRKIQDHESKKAAQQKINLCNDDITRYQQEIGALSDEED
jgi:hypothetical protein